MIWYYYDQENLMLKTKLKTYFKVLKKLNLVCFTQIVFKLLSEPKIYWIWTVSLPYDILTDT